DTLGCAPSICGFTTLYGKCCPAREGRRMAEKVDYYALLFVAPSADIEIIKAAYRILAKRHHPDVGMHPTSETIEQFRLIQEAFDVLSDPRARAEYDSTRVKDTGGVAYRSWGQIHPEKFHRDPSVWSAALVVAAVVLFLFFQMHS